MSVWGHSHSSRGALGRMPGTPPGPGSSLPTPFQPPCRRVPRGGVGRVFVWSVRVPHVGVCEAVGERTRACAVSWSAPTCLSCLGVASRQGLAWGCPAHRAGRMLPPAGQAGQRTWFSGWGGAHIPFRVTGGRWPRAAWPRCGERPRPHGAPQSPCPDSLYSTWLTGPAPTLRPFTQLSQLPLPCKDTKASYPGQNLSGGP